MKVVNILLNFPIFATVLQAASVPCAGEGLLEEIADRMFYGIDSITFIGSELAKQCTSEPFSCVSYNLNLLLEVERGQRFFNQAINLYSGFLNETSYRPTCSLEQPVCNCTSFDTLISYINNTYNVEYDTLWTQFALGNTTNCTDTAIELRKLVSTYYCNTEQVRVNMIQCKDECALRCFSAEDEEFKNRTRNMMLEANALIDSAQDKFFEQCDPNFSCSAANITTIISELTGAANIYEQVVEEYNTFLNVTGYNATCVLPAAGSCNCTDMLYLFYNVSYTLRNDYIGERAGVNAGTVEDCTASLEYLRDTVDRMECLTRAIIQDYEVCKGKCPQRRPCNLPSILEVLALLAHNLCRNRQAGECCGCPPYLRKYLESPAEEADN